MPKINEATAALLQRKMMFEHALALLEVEAMLLDQDPPRSAEYVEKLYKAIAKLSEMERVNERVIAVVKELSPAPPPKAEAEPPVPPPEPPAPVEETPPPEQKPKRRARRTTKKKEE